MKLNIKLSLALIMLLSVAALSCLKDKAFENGEIQSVHTNGATPKIIEIKLTAGSIRNVLGLSFNESLIDTVINLIPVNLATSEPASQDIHVTLTQNDQIVTDYNAANTDTTVTPDNPNPTGKVTHYLIPTLYTIVNPGGVVIVPKGEHTGYLQMKFKPSDFLGATYALGFTISKVDESGYTISGNNQKGMVIINIKNQFDGDYTVTGWFFHPSAGRAIGEVKHLSTVNSTRVEGAFADFGSGTTMQFSVINNVATNWSSDAFLSNGFMVNDNPGGVNYSDASNEGHLPGDANFNKTIYNNTYDPATKTFYLHYGYNAGVVGGESVYTRQVYEKWVRKQIM